MAGVIPLIEHGDLQEAEVQPVAGAPDDGGDAFGVEVQTGAGLVRQPVDGGRSLRGRRVDAGCGDVRVKHHLHPLPERRLHLREPGGEVVAEGEDAVVRSLEVAVQPVAPAA